MPSELINRALGRPGSTHPDPKVEAYLVKARTARSQPAHFNPIIVTDLHYVETTNGGEGITIHHGCVESLTFLFNVPRPGLAARIRDVINAALARSAED